MRHDSLLDDRSPCPFACRSPQFTQAIHELIGEPSRIGYCFCLKRVRRRENGIEGEEHNRRVELVEPGPRVGQVLTILVIGGLVYFKRYTASQRANPQAPGKM